MGYWKKIRYWIEAMLLRILAFIVPFLSRKMCVELADLLGHLFHDSSAKDRAVALANLEVAFGERFTTEEREIIALKSAQNMARTFLDLFWSSRIGTENYWQWMKVDIHESVFTSEENKIGHILMCPHFGNFEWMGLAAGFSGIDIPVIEQEFKNSQLGPIFDRIRSISGNTVLPRSGVMIRVLKHLKKGGYLGLLPDLTLPPGKTSTIVRFFGLETCVTAMPAELFLRTGCLLHPAISLPQPDGSCELHYYAPLSVSEKDSVQKITQTIWNFFETWVYKYPHLWLWHYKHWRYCPSDYDRPYPFYANLSSRYEKLRQALNYSNT